MSRAAGIADIRREAPGDAPAIHALFTAAFGGRAEADLVDALRRDGDLALSLVATVEGGVRGCVCFSPARIDAAPALVLGPLAVSASLRRGAIGSRLVREGLKMLGETFGGPVVVRGDPAYYSRFGFRLAPGLVTPLRAPALLTLHLGGVDAPPEGALTRAPAFARLV